MFENMIFHDLVYQCFAVNIIGGGGMNQSTTSSHLIYNKIIDILYIVYSVSSSSSLLCSRKRQIVYQTNDVCGFNEIFRAIFSLLGSPSNSRRERLFRLFIVEANRSLLLVQYIILKYISR